VGRRELRLPAQLTASLCPPAGARSGRWRIGMEPDDPADQARALRGLDLPEPYVLAYPR